MWFGMVTVRGGGGFGPYRCRSLSSNCPHWDVIHHTTPGSAASAMRGACPPPLPHTDVTTPHLEAQQLPGEAHVQASGVEDVEGALQWHRDRQLPVLDARAPHAAAQALGEHALLLDDKRGAGNADAKGYVFGWQVTDLKGGRGVGEMGRWGGG